MDIKSAIDSFHKEYPGKKVKGYWQDGEKIILNIEPSYGQGCPEVCQFIVQANGTILPTNPALSPIMIKTEMKTL